MPRAEQRHLRRRARHLAEVGFFDQQVGFLERRFERRIERIGVLRQEVHRAGQIDGPAGLRGRLPQKIRARAGAACERRRDQRDAQWRRRGVARAREPWSVFIWSLWRFMNASISSMVRGTAETAGAGRSFEQERVLDADADVCVLRHGRLNLLDEREVLRRPRQRVERALADVDARFDRERHAGCERRASRSPTSWTSMPM